MIFSDNSSLMQSLATVSNPWNCQAAHRVCAKYEAAQVEIELLKKLHSTLR